MNTKTNFTKRCLDDLRPRKSRYYIYDVKVPQLGVTVYPSGSKSFHIRTTVHSQTRRIAIKKGKYPGMKIAQARKAALDLLSEVAGGGDPVEKRRGEKIIEVTLREILERYLSERRDRQNNPLKPYTKKDYRKAINETFKDYLDKPLTDITSDVVLKLYKARKEGSPSRASNAARVLSALFNFARVEYRKADGESYFSSNPVDAIKERKLRYVAPRRKTHIAKENLRQWFDVVESIDTQDYLKFILLTGIRGGEADGLQWEHIDFNRESFTLVDPKNRETVELPLPSSLKVKLYERRQGSGKVFEVSDEGRWLRKTVIKKLGIEFTRHDLRRTFATVAEGLDISWLSIKRLMNHKTQESGVTEGYIMVDMDRLKAASKKVEEAILEAAGR
ncbi:MAG: integrase family protein [Candidatus Thiodiazotropha sp. (ex Codakia orbicularis)]|nr:integrase family protein [Candidatus Thiodiazotropha sp. (ex Codakia orbicularis)]